MEHEQHAATSTTAARPAGKGLGHDPVLTIDEVAAETGRHYRTVREWLVADPPLLRGTKRGNRWYIRRSALEEFLGGD